MNSLLIICGPTATGKTELAIKIAKKFNGELINADSRQVYKGMDIGTGKDLPSDAKFTKAPTADKRNFDIGYYLINKIPLWLLDIVSPDYNFNVADYQKLAWVVIKDIWQRKKLPILVGGTGLYIKALIDGIGTINIPLNQKLRNKLVKLSLEKLQKEIQNVNLEKWNQMNNSDKQNPRRLIRAIEIAKQKKPSKLTLFDKNFNSLFIGLSAPNKILYERIDQRVEDRINSGMEKEIRTLLSLGYDWNFPSMSGIGYRLWRDYFNKKKTLKEIIQRWKFDEHSYSRRQQTWFKKDKRIKWFFITKPTTMEEIINSVQQFVNN